ncbi:MAG: sulfate adenylyltransferase subunit CysN [Caldilineaceae bacterium]|nr:sulfate adenylyltransferase subunit CysN [Caldilineaceae bacterium]
MHHAILHEERLPHAPAAQAQAVTETAAPQTLPAVGGDLLRFTTAGSVDDGKSTLIGRLLYDSKAIFEDQLEAITLASRRRGDEGVDLALLTDGLRAEREQGITIDVAYRYFATPKRKFIIADTPGHIQYTRNMVTGASTADLAIILVDAEKGVVTQSRRHAFLASLLQIPHILVAINKMDLVDYSRSVYEAIVQEFTAFASKLSIRDLTYIPISALRGDNVVHTSAAMPWYQGSSLLHHLEHVSVAGSRNLIDFRFPVQMALRPNREFRGFAGQVASGSITPGEEIAVLPSGRTSRVRSILAAGDAAEEAIQGDSIVLTLEDEIDISRGDMIVRRRNLPQAADRLECALCWLAEEPLKRERAYLLQHTTRHVQAYVSKLAYRIDVDTLHRVPATTLQLNEIGRAVISTAQPLYFDPYVINRATGSFILIDPSTNNTVAAGMIRRAAQELEEVAPQAVARPRAANVVWEESTISRERREAQHGHAGAVLWFTGLSGAGKSTVARLLEERLYARGCHTFRLDGDNVRHGLNGDLGFSAADRQENIRRVAEVARLAFDHGQIVICTFISPYQADRNLARSRLPEGRFLEIWVKCDLDVCKRRDPKGLYARAERGEIAEFTGVSAPYEPPAAPELVVETDVESPEAIVERILAELERRGLISYAAAGGAFI